MKPEEGCRLAEENEILRTRLKELEETLAAIRSGEVDAIVVKTDVGEQIYSLSSAETTYRILIEQMHEGAAIISEGGTLIYCNRRFAEMIRVPIEKVMGRQIIDILPEGVNAQFTSLLKRGISEHVQKDLMMFNSSSNDNSSDDTHYLCSMAPFVYDSPNNMASKRTQRDLFVSLTLTDISFQKNLERRLLEHQAGLEEKIVLRTLDLRKSNQELEASRRKAFDAMRDALNTSRKLRKSEAKLKEAQKVGKIGSWEYDLVGDTFTWSDEMYRLHELDAESEPVRFDEPSTHYAPEQAKLFRSYADKALESGESKELDLRATTAGGTLVVFATIIKPVYDTDGRITGLHGTLQDVTERKRTSEQIAHELSQKKILLRELYHRTENNMQVIASMLRLRTHEVNDPQLSTTFKEIENRILGMALAHQKLYESEDLSQLNLRDYLESLILIIKDFHSDELTDVSIRYSMDDIPVLIDIAVPVGLVVTELISNAFKHAFPNGRKGIIEVKLFFVDNMVPVLEIGDNGVGVPEGFDPITQGNLGLQIVYSLVKDQLGGSVTLTKRNGLSFRLTFDNELYAKRV
ncbi:MAG: PAS domain S-box protein [Spirochaetaceae bacterium]|nr:PAS domain S-box protein [Spirochaetaceae bacterium]MCF7947194.1 PAS domain S-box protein [Spirochaetia bacterium]MCF7950059.1 PAS domain S-box protein [Spirochaetaceae bacterium]